jgi:hypothetical protein
MPPPHHFSDDGEPFGVYEFGSVVGVVGEQRDLVFACHLNAFGAGVAIIPKPQKGLSRNNAGAHHCCYFSFHTNLRVKRQCNIERTHRLWQIT